MGDMFYQINDLPKYYDETITTEHLKKWTPEKRQKLQDGIPKKLEILKRKAQQYPNIKSSTIGEINRCFAQAYNSKLAHETQTGNCDAAAVLKEAYEAGEKRYNYCKFYAEKIHNPNAGVGLDRNPIDPNNLPSNANYIMNEDTGQVEGYIIRDNKGNTKYYNAKGDCVHWEEDPLVDTSLDHIVGAVMFFTPMGKKVPRFKGTNMRIGEAIRSGQKVAIGKKSLPQAIQTKLSQGVAKAKGLIIKGMEILQNALIPQAAKDGIKNLTKGGTDFAQALLKRFTSGNCNVMVRGSDGKAYLFKIIGKENDKLILKYVETKVSSAVMKEKPPINLNIFKKIFECIKNAPANNLSRQHLQHSLSNHAHELGIDGISKGMDLLSKKGNIPQLFEKVMNKIRTHMSDPETICTLGTWDGKAVYHYYNPRSGLLVMVNKANNEIESFFIANADKVSRLATHGNLGKH